MNPFDVVRPKEAPIERPLTRCPGCGSDNLRTVADAESDGVDFCCGMCGAYWHVELGYVHRVRVAGVA